jgi:hypothetical protein
LGAGGSHALNCTFYDANDPQSFLGYFFPLNDVINDVKKCRERLETQADLTLYTTPIAMDDLDELIVRAGFNIEFLDERNNIKAL